MEVMVMRKIGLLGGTFDPIHNGHLIIAEYLRDHLSLEEIWFIPARCHPLKDNEIISTPEVRYRMLQIAIADNPAFKSLDIELKREGVSYTIDTLNYLADKFHALVPEFYFLIGMDIVNELHRWKDPQQILEKSIVIAFGRPGFKANKAARVFLPYIQFIHVPLLEISSSLIRQRCQDGRSIRYLVPEEVREYITEKKLYLGQGK
jgi:nicotinate-nucleotide adenylyltransferase